jgi:histone-lysine N-methyltransferase SETMAR
MADINDTYGQDVVSLRTVQKWTQRYTGGDDSFEDLARSGRPRKDELIPSVIQIMEQEPHVSQNKLAEILGVHHHTINRILTEELGLTRVNFRWIPYKLNDDQKAKRVEIAKSMLHVLANASLPQLKMILTGDETWVYLSNPRSSMWIDSAVGRPEKPKLTVGTKKVMITVFWSPSGMHLIHMLPPGERFTKEFFINEILAVLYNKICSRREKKKTKGYFLHFDNARPHLVDDTLDEMGFQRLPHPPFSPDLAPSDFFLFGYMKFLLEGKEFESPQQLHLEVSRILNSIPVSVLQDAYHEWIKRLRLCIEQEGEYIH